MNAVIKHRKCKVSDRKWCSGLIAGAVHPRACLRLPYIFHKFGSTVSNLKTNLLFWLRLYFVALSYMNCY